MEAHHGTAHFEPVALLTGIEWLVGEDAFADNVVVLVEGASK
jgi:hypothetical protein